MCSYVAKRFRWRSSSMGRRGRMDGPSLINRTINQGPPILDLRLRWAVCPLAFGPPFHWSLALCIHSAPCYYFPAVPKFKAGDDQDADAHIVLYCVVLYCAPHTHIYTHTHVRTTWDWETDVSSNKLQGRVLARIILLQEGFATFA